MFDVEAIRDLVLQSLTFYPYAYDGLVIIDVNLYTASGDYSGKEFHSNSWTQIITNQSISTTCEI